MNRLFLYVSSLILQAPIHPLCAQEGQGGVTRVYASALPIQLSANKTTTLVFPSPIRGVDRGSADVLAQKAVGSDLILQLKAGRTGFEETNLTVITAGGGLYTFSVTYARLPRELMITLSPPPPSADEDKRSVPVSSLHSRLEKVLGLKSKGLIRYKKGERLLLGLEGVYLEGRTVFLKLYCQNRSPLPFLSDSLRFTLKDKIGLRNRAGQSIPLLPIVQTQPEEIAQNSSKRVAVAIDGLSFSRRKQLEVEWGEKGGGRKMVLKIPVAALRYAGPVPQ